MLKDIARFDGTNREQTQSYIFKDSLKRLTLSYERKISEIYDQNVSYQFKDMTKNLQIHLKNLSFRYFQYLYHINGARIFFDDFTMYEKFQSDAIDKYI